MQHISFRPLLYTFPSSFPTFLYASSFGSLISLGIAAVLHHADMTLTDIPTVFGSLFTLTSYLWSPTVDSKYSIYMYKNCKREASCRRAVSSFGRVESRGGRERSCRSRYEV
ncbi:hypothetical protein BC827DRAFT_1240157, partial [Russula dissimulans]